MKTKTVLLGSGLLLGLLSSMTPAIGLGVGTSLGAQAAGRADRVLDGMQQKAQQQQPAAITTDTPQDRATARMLEETNPTEEQLQRAQPNLDSKTIPVGNHHH